MNSNRDQANYCKYWILSVSKNAFISVVSNWLGSLRNESYTSDTGTASLWKYTISLSIGSKIRRHFFKLKKNIGKPRKTFLGRLEYLGFCEKPAKT